VLKSGLDIINAIDAGNVIVHDGVNSDISYDRLADLCDNFDYVKANIVQLRIGEFSKLPKPTDRLLRARSTAAKQSR
jgi:hypothetical protein